MRIKVAIDDMDVSDVVTSSPSAKSSVHGVLVGEVSPLKTSRKRSDVKYFDGKFSDGKKTVRLVSFEPKLHKEFQDAQREQRPVVIEDCILKRNRDQMEIVVDNKTTITNSPKKFRVNESDALPRLPELVTLDDVKDVAERQQVSLVAKIISLGKVEQVNVKSCGKCLSKCEAVLADCTAACRCVLWEEHTGKVHEEQCYKITNATVRQFNGVKYVSIGEKTIIEPSDAITDVVDETAMQDETGGIIVVKAEVVSVISIDSYFSCRNCPGTETKKGVGECGKCKAKVKLAKCKNRNVARIEIEKENDGVQYKLTVFDDVVEKIARFCQEDGSSEEDISELLLLSPMLSYIVNLNKETVCSVARIV